MEERILVEGPDRLRRTLADGTVVDLSFYDETGIIVTIDPGGDPFFFLDVVIA